MTLTTAHDRQRIHLLAAIRNANVAAAAGVDATAWASTTSPRVLAGDAAGYIGGLHRGRLPAVEIIETDDTWDRQTPNGGTIESAWIIRAHVADRSKATAEAKARAIILEALTQIRADEYLAEGEDVFTGLVAGPLGHYLEVRVTLAHAYGEDSHEVTNTAAPIPGPGPGPD